MLCETKMTTKAFFEKTLSVLAKRVFLLDFEGLVKLANVNLRTVQNQVLHEKLLERLLEEELSDDNLFNVDFKLFSYLIWSLCDAADKEKVEPVFARYEVLIDLKQLLSPRDVSHLLWAVTLKYKINLTTFAKLKGSLIAYFEQIYKTEIQSLMEQKDYFHIANQFASVQRTDKQDQLEKDISTWDIMNIMWGLSKFATPEVDPLIRLMCPLVDEQLNYFTAMELVMIFRVLTEKDYLNFSQENEAERKPVSDGSKLGSSEYFYKQLIEQLVSTSPQMEDSQILLIMFQLVKCPHLQFCDHTATLQQLFNIREELKKKITLDTERIEEAIDLADLEAKRALAQGRTSRSDTSSNLINKPF